MPVPSNPSTLTLVADAMNQALQNNATSASSVVTSNAAMWLENVKVQLWGASSSDKLLDTTSVLLTTVGGSLVALPTDFDHETELRVYDGPTASNRDTFQNANANAGQFATTFSADQASVLGQWVFTLSGMGAAQETQIATFDSTTNWATWTTPFATAPTSTTTYVVATEWWALTKYTSSWGVHLNGKPLRYRMVGTTTYVTPPSDQIYPIRCYYGANLTRLDDTGAVFLKHLRERRYYWIQGLKVEILGQFDDDRYGGELAKWGTILQNYAGKNPVYSQASFTR